MSDLLPPRPTMRPITPAPESKPVARARFRFKGPWYVEYVDDLYNPKWKLIADKSNTSHVEVWAIVCALRNAARKKNANGDIGDFSFEECAAGLQQPLTPDRALAIGRALLEDGWLQQHFIVSWSDEQPLQNGDTTAKERQAKKRALDKARNAYKLGFATPEQIELLSIEERAQLDRLRTAASHVTERKDLRPVKPPFQPFIRSHPDGDTPSAIQECAAFNDECARQWLLGKGAVGDFGIGSYVVASHMGCAPHVAASTIIGWCGELDGDRVKVAEIISAAQQQNLSGAGFMGVVRQRLDAEIAERTKGPSLPLGPHIAKRA